MTDNQTIQPHILHRFQIVKKIGCGAYGIVWKVLDRQNNNKMYALKKNFDAFQNSTDAQRTYRQIMFLRELHHPNIVNLVQQISAHNDKDVYLLFEFMDIDLYVLIREGLLNEQQCRYILYQIAKALYYMHSGEVIHRDIKPSNVLVNQDCTAKLCDFGLVRSVQEKQTGKKYSKNVMTDYIATRWYRAPQILLGSKKYTKTVDIWSYGCMMAEIIKGRPLFPGNSTLNQIERVVAWTGTPTPDDLQALQTDFGQSMLNLLQKIKTVNRKQFIGKISADGMHLLSKILQFNPKNRPNMLQILKSSYFKEFYQAKDITILGYEVKLAQNDNNKISLKQYRLLIEQHIKKLNPSQLISPMTALQIPNVSKHHMDNSKTLTKHRPYKVNEKNRVHSLPMNNQKQGRTIIIGHKQNTSHKIDRTNNNTKHSKTQPKQDMIFFENRLKQRIVQQNDISSGIIFRQKRKSTSYKSQNKKKSQLLARQVYLGH